LDQETVKSEPPVVAPSPPAATPPPCYRAAWWTRAASCGLTPRPGSRRTITGLNWLGGVRRNKKGRLMSALGQSRRTNAGSSCARCPLYLQ